MGELDQYVDDIGFPHPDVRTLVNSIIYIKKNVPSEFLTEEHERLNLVFFAREFINADKRGVTEAVNYSPPTFKLFTPGEAEEDDSSTDEPDPI